MVHWLGMWLLDAFSAHSHMLCVTGWSAVPVIGVTFHPHRGSSTTAVSHIRRSTLPMMPPLMPVVRKSTRRSRRRSYRPCSERLSTAPRGIRAKPNSSSSPLCPLPRARITPGLPRSPRHQSTPSHRHQPPPPHSARVVAGRQ